MASNLTVKDEYGKITNYIGDWGAGLNKQRLLGNIHRNLMGVNKLGAPRPIEDLAFFLLIAKQYGLNPLKNEIYATYQLAKSGNQWVEKIVPIPSIHGLRRLARQTKNPTYAYTGKADFAYKDDSGKELDSATVEVFGYFDDPTKTQKVGEYTAYMEEFAQKTKDGQYRSNWARMPRVMLAKCAEANVIRTAFGIGGIYVEEEISDDESKILRLNVDEAKEVGTEE